MLNHIGIISGMQLSLCFCSIYLCMNKEDLYPIGIKGTKIDEGFKLIFKAQSNMQHSCICSITDDHSQERAKIRLRRAFLPVF